ncbi:hypothetical protein DFQ27_007224 [Actinomortierella ambigua]|uniref:Calcineurin-like phosphoesterase domain-containing protein n=1 Tax=Actinomortierella ambigua TaxID=1343610 RepID=A0A9P6QJR8_9FUNG|nr:hypothetical protein DFQ27_007224 [Actinomortierella ambigua]
MIAILLLSFLSLALAHVERRAQAGALDPEPIALRPLEWGDVNFIATTDTHGWLQGHPDDPSYSGDFGDFASFVSHMRDQATHRRTDLFVIDSGDIHHGTGIADDTKTAGTMTDPIFEKVRYDLLTPGNHELYDNELANTMYKIYAPRWGNRYLTSNVFFKDVVTNKTVPLGTQYTTFRGKFGTRVLAYGFMYNFTTPATNAVVEFCNTTVQQQWFLESLKEESDIIVIVGHNPVRSPELRMVIDAIRQVHPARPIIVFGGHNHVRDFTQYDARAAGLSAGRFMETVGWMSVDGLRNAACGIDSSAVDCIGKNLTFHRRYMDTNRYTYITHSMAHPKQKFDTWRGEKITKEIAEARRKLDVTKVLGQAPMDYYVTRVPFTHPQSIFKWLQDEVLETVLLPTRPYPAMVVSPTGMVRYDIQKGDFTVDDVFVICPYHFKFVYFSLKAVHARRLLEVMANFTKPTGGRDGSGGNHTSGSKEITDAVQWATHPLAPAQADLTPGYVTMDDYGTGGDDWPHLPVPVYLDAPVNVASKLAADVPDGTEIDLVFIDYYAKPVLKALAVLDPNGTYVPTSYRRDFDLAGMFANFAKLKWNKKE